MASVSRLELRRLNVGEYHRMIEAGVFGEDERLELLEGVIVRVSPQKERHARVIERLNRRLVASVPGGFRVRPRLPLTLGDDNEPEPDLAVVGPDDGAVPDEHPRSAVLVVEVAGDSLLNDRSVKGPLYARFGVPEYWIVVLADECVEVHRNPDTAQARYSTVLILGRGQELRSLAVGGVALRVDDLFD